MLQVLGPDAKLERDRMKLEVQVYREWGALLGKELEAKYFPVIYKLDLDSMAFLMEFLGSFKLLSESLFEGFVDVRVAAEMGEAMGLMHGKTHVKVVDAEEAARLTEVYANETLRGIQVEYVYTKVTDASVHTAAAAAAASPAAGAAALADPLLVLLWLIHCWCCSG